MPDHFRSVGETKRKGTHRKRFIMDRDYWVVYTHQAVPHPSTPTQNHWLEEGVKLQGDADDRWQKVFEECKLPLALLPFPRKHKNDQKA